MKFNTKTIHGGQITEKAYGAVMPPIYQTSTYAQKSPGNHKGFEYSRTQLNHFWILLYTAEYSWKTAEPFLDAAEPFLNTTGNS